MSMYSAKALSSNSGPSRSKNVRNVPGHGWLLGGRAPPRVLLWYGVPMGPREQEEGCILETGCRKKPEKNKDGDLAVVHRGMPLGDWCPCPEDGR